MFTTKKTVPAMFSISIKWLLNSLVAVCLYCFVSPEAQGQIVQTERYEIPVTSRDDEFSIIPASVNGLYLNRVIEDARETYLQLIKLDTAFKENWSGVLPIPKNYLIASRKVSGNNLYVLMRYVNYSNNNLLLYIINNTDGSFMRHPIKSYIPFLQTEFEITDRAVLIGGYYGTTPFVLHYDTRYNRSKVLPGLFNEIGELNQIKTNADNSFDVLIAARNRARQKTIWIKSYTSAGDLIENRALKPEGSNHLLFGREVRPDESAQIVAGVFGNRMKEFSKGIFVTSLSTEGETTRYYNFSDMENFFKFMKAKREQRVKSRIQRKKIHGKKIRMMYRFMLHELVPYQDNYILLGEAFYPKYQNANNNFHIGGYNFGSPYGASRIFAGYQYTHAVVMCFDKQGNMLWDNSFEINDLRSFTLEQFVKLEVHEDKIAMMYLFDGQIRTKVIKNNQVLEGKTSDGIKTLRQSDFVKNNAVEQGKLDYWYGDKLYACGVQEIVNHGIGKRKVFFINKVTFKD
ncbi:MAG TPA: hypothetical protein VGD40_04210 [Chryseosolibacter sp.]